MIGMTQVLPITIGFIFPDGRMIDASGGRGHNKAAIRYILKNKELNQACIKSGLNDQDFLMYMLGAAKICAYSGIRYIYVPYIHNEYIRNMKDLYEQHGFKVVYFSSRYCDKISSDSIVDFKLDIQNLKYTPQVVHIKDPEGNTLYCYNPNRIGD